jgi:ElaB/YqjD/DUF883 family membrane-anchored ribosome-binding protein
MTDAHSSLDTDQAVSQLSQSVAQAAESHRLLTQEMTVFAKDEGLRFANLRLERNGAALDKLQNCVGLPGLIGVQQEWVRDFLQDYASQGMRMMGALRGLTKNAMESAAQNASENIERMQHEAKDMAHKAQDAIHQAQDTGYQAAQQAGEQMNTIVQDTNNNYIQH